MSETAAPPRHCRLRFTRPPDAGVRARVAAAADGLSPAPGLQWENDALHVEYRFPDCSFDDCWNALRAAELDRDLRNADRVRGGMRALLEHNEREFLRHPGGWRRHLDRLYLACAAPAAAAARGGRLWRKHEKG